MSKLLENKVAIVTGASKGIGASIAEHLADSGASVVVNYASDRIGAERVVSTIKGNGGKAIAVRADVSKPAEIDRLVAESLAAYDRVDVLVNNAGVYDFKPLGEITPEHFHKQFDLNVLGLLLTTQAVVKHMPAGGSIINVGSVAGTSPPITASVYSASKAAVDAITKALAKELGPRQIRVNSLNPGAVETEGANSMGVTLPGSPFRAKIEAETPLGRIGQPGDIATVAVFLASPDAGWMTGEMLYVSGGNR